jgi:type 1 glutamine amidotransferase
MNIKSIKTTLTICALTALIAGPFATLSGKAPSEQDIAKIKEALPTKAPAKPLKARKILIFSKTNGFRHGSIETGAKALTLLGEKTGAWTAVHSEDDSMFEPDTLKQFDAVVMVNTTGDLFRPRKLPGDADQKKAAMEREERLKKSLVDFVKSGKGLAGTHSATDTYKNWKEYNKMMGGAFAGHPWHKKVPVQILAAAHPLTKAFAGSEFEVTDEIYQFRNDTALSTDRKMLLALDNEKFGENEIKRGRRDDKFYPISWVAKYGEGRTFYCSLGHRNEIYWNPKVLKHYLAGIQYALGDLEADATPTKK